MRVKEEGRRDMISVENNQKLLTIKQVPSSSGVKRRRRREPEILIPNDLIEEILVRLPVKSLIRFQIVSKYWGSIIRSKDFEERYMDHHKSKDPKLFFICYDLVKRSKNTLFMKTMALETMTASLEQERAVEFQEFRGYLEISESCNGLVCIFGMTIRVQVLNPATGIYTVLPLAQIQLLHIRYPNPKLQLDPVPDPNPNSNPNPGPVPFYAFTRFGFGRDNVTGRYKLVWLYNKYPTASPLSDKKKTSCEVLDLENKKWKFVSTTPLDHHHILTDQRPAFANGSFYWLTGDEEGYPTRQTKLVVFDIHTHMFQLIPTPSCIPRDAFGDDIGLCNLDGRLCISEIKQGCKQEFWWRVQDNNTWEKIFSVDLRFTSTWFGGITSRPLTPLAFSKDNNKVILSLRDYGNLIALDLDPDSTVYHLYFPGYYGLAVPYLPTLSRFHLYFH